MNAFVDTLDARCAEGGRPLVVGMDPIPDLMPPDFALPLEAGVKEWAEVFDRFARRILPQLRGVAVAMKFQSAYYERLGEVGLAVLRKSMAFAKENGFLTILDVKRADIGSTAAAYAEAYLGTLEGTCGPVTDAVTVNPYLGEDGVEPFVELAASRGKGVFVLVKTSNPSGPQFQDLKAQGEPLWRHVARMVDKLGGKVLGECGLSAVGAVVAATYPQILSELRALMPRSVLLLPGIGAQGGRVSDLAAAFLPGRRGALITASRSILYAWRSRPERPFEQAARAAAEELAQELDRLPAVGG